MVAQAAVERLFAERGRDLGMTIAPFESPADRGQGPARDIRLR